MYHRGWYFWFNILVLRGIFMGELFKNNFSVLALTSKFTDGLPTGGNPHTKMYSRAGFRKLFSNAQFKNIQIVTNYNPNEWNAWPIKRFAFGGSIPTRVQRFLSEVAGFSFSATIVAEK